MGLHNKEKKRKEKKRKERKRKEIKIITKNPHTLETSTVHSTTTTTKKKNQKKNNQKIKFVIFHNSPIHGTGGVL